MLNVISVALCVCCRHIRGYRFVDRRFCASNIVVSWVTLLRLASLLPTEHLSPLFSSSHFFFRFFFSSSEKKISRSERGLDVCHFFGVRDVGRLTDRVRNFSLCVVRLLPRCRFVFFLFSCAHFSPLFGIFLREKEGYLECAAPA